MNVEGSVGIPNNWVCIQNADIGIGSGSYFLDDETISLLYPDVVSIEEAWKKVSALEDTDNPIVLWEIRPGGMRAHRYKFFEQTYEGKTEDYMSAEKFAKLTASFLKGNPDNNGWPVMARVDAMGKKEWVSPFA